MTSLSMRITILLLVVGSLAGCSTSANYHDVHFDGTIEGTQGQFVMDGNVSIGIGAAPDATFSNVTVVLYDENKMVIRRVPVGKLTTSGPPHTQRVNITINKTPSYVLIESPDFWQSDTNVQVNAYKHSGDGNSYEVYSRTTAGERFPDT